MTSAAALDAAGARAELGGSRAGGHPRGLTVLVVTEIWEQFSYYGMRALLIYYMIGTLGFSQPRASMVYAFYIAAAYFTPILGGIVTDRFLGRRRAVAIGSAIMALGHFAMASEALFYLALGLIALGNGLYVPSIASQISTLYRPGDARRKSAFSIYYMGGNVGGFLAPIICGFLGETYGWHWGFGIAGLGMLVGLAVYLLGERHLNPIEDAAPELVASAGVRDEERGRMMLLIIVLMVVILFRGAYEQLGNTVALWIAQADRAAGALTIPMTWFQALNGLLVILLTPLILALWRRRSAGSATAARMAIGAGTVCMAYLLASALALLAEQSGTATAWPWIVLFFVLITTGELYILPVGLGLFGRLAPRRIGATIISIWFAAISAGSLLSGLLGAYWTALGPPLFFAMIAAVAGTASLLCVLLIPWVRRVEERCEAAQGGAA